MAIRAYRTQIFDRIQSVGPASARYRFDVVNLNVIGGFRSIRSQKGEPTDDATPTIAPQTRLAGLLISLLGVYGDLAHGPFRRAG
jgi:hypothetical protein